MRVVINFFNENFGEFQIKEGEYLNEDGYVDLSLWLNEIFSYGRLFEILKWDDKRKKYSVDKRRFREMFPNICFGHASWIRAGEKVVTVENDGEDSPLKFKVLLIEGGYRTMRYDKKHII